jgi:hypothetical protein
MKKILPVMALIGFAVSVHDADAAKPDSAFEAILVSVTSYSQNPAAVWNGSLDTSTWTFNPATGTAVQTGGTYSRLMRAGVTPFQRHTMTGATLGNFAPTATSWACIEGTFGTAVNVSVCGNYNFGLNLTNESTYTPTTTGAYVLIGGDDGAIGLPHSLVTSYSGMLTTSLGGNKYCLSNSNATAPADRCTPAGTSAIAGYDFIFERKPQGKKK